MYSVLNDKALDFLNEAEDDISNILEESISSIVSRLDLAGMTKLHHAVRDINLTLDSVPYRTTRKFTQQSESGEDSIALRFSEFIQRHRYDETAVEFRS
jgi:hypothetical protein